MAKAFSVSVNIGGKLNPSLGAAVRAAETQINGLGRHVSAINTRTQSAISDFGRGIASAGRKIQDTGRNVTAGLSAPTGLLAFGAGKMAFEFEKAGNFLEALGDASEEQRKKFEGLAGELNKKYPQTLAQIISTGNEMLKGGFTFDQMTGAIDQTLATAILGEMSPAEVGNMMARTINSFQMPMKTYEDAMKSSTQVSDRMTYAAVKTTASLKDMGEMFRYVGGAMSATGGSLDEATAFGMLFAKNGTVGSEAGVALRSAIVRMVKMPAKGEAALNRIGMNLNKYVGGKSALTSDRILAGLQSGGIDATGIKGQIDRLLKDKKLAGSTARLQSAITKAVQSHIGSNGALDAATIAENVNDSITMAGSQINLVGFFRDLKSKIESGQATMGDVATILEGRHFSRYVPLLQGNIDETIAQIQGESNGYTQSRYGTVLKGPVGAIYELDAALEKLSVTLGRVAFPDLAKGFSAVADGLQRLSEANPTLLKFGAYTGLATIALGPFLFAAGATLRVVAPLATALLTLGRAATLGLAAQLTGLASSLTTLAVAASAGLVARIRALGAGLIVLNSVGGSTAVLAALGGSLASAGRAVLMFPVTALRAIGSALMLLVANPVGIAITAIVTALAALGVWVYNNWSGITSFFSGFAEGLKAGLNPTLVGYIDSLASGFGKLFSWVSQLLGPLNSSKEAWAAWGATVGGTVATAINAVADGISRVIGFFGSAIDKAIAFKDAIANIRMPWSSAPPSAPAVAGARAAGGPVVGGRTYLVGERGPELFTAPTSGEIVPNDRLRSLASKSVAHASGGRAPASQGDVHMTNHFTINGAQDPQAVAREVERFMWRMESEQRALLSD
ncbi:phage tail tape measure protein [Microvirga calopogonii]|uniref:phage tail tape measure protein n=1 Tax=Microvirga calopogonii TaxID=2078013 RepID=UPI0013B3D59C|nr:phage tail tape measure protein [Microvirga calopogonii]